MHLHMTGERSIVGENRRIAHLTIVSDVTVSHNPIIITHSGDSSPGNGTAVDGDVFADGVARTDFKPGALTLEFLVLGYFANGGELKDPIVSTDPCRPLYDDMRPDPSPGLDLHVRTYDRIRANHDIMGKLRRRGDNGAGVDHVQISRIVQRICACATRTCWTCDSAANIQMPRMLRLKRTDNRS